MDETKLVENTRNQTQTLESSPANAGEVSHSTSGFCRYVTHLSVKQSF